MRERSSTPHGGPRRRWALSASGVSATEAEWLSDLADVWALRIAALLGQPLPPAARVLVHPGEGIAHAEPGTVHLFRRAAGDVDTDQLPHELVHVIAGPSPSRFLSEGLAVHIADMSRLGPMCWPAYRLSPDLWITRLDECGRDLPRLRDAVAAAEGLRLARAVTAGADAIRAAWTIYIMAGSFTGFLMATMPPDAFWRGYRAGACWDDSDTLADLEYVWRGALPRELDAQARADLVASLMEAGPRGTRAALARREAEPPLATGG